MYIRKDENALFCKCGCGNGVIFKADKENNEVSLQLVSDKFYSDGNDLKNTMREKLKRIWYVITNKEYCYFDILIENNDLKEFKEFVAKL